MKNIKLFYLTCGLIIFAFGFYLCNLQQFKPKSAAIEHYIRMFYQDLKNESKQHSKQESKPPKFDINYDEAINNISKQRADIAKRYNLATEQEKQKVIAQARQAFIYSTTSLLPYWYGTPWDFNGVTYTPQQGKIACGYYVTTTLKGTGLIIERNLLAQQASENIIKTLTSENHIKRYSKVNLNEFVDAIKQWGAGVYIVGLDFHVGYILNDGESIKFIHSSALYPRSVVAELAAESQALRESNYRVVGKISADDKFILKWLTQSKFETVL